jgi:acetylornithine deacetylase/succinyl-diaminopimelate desuccinylase-like protein
VRPGGGLRTWRDNDPYVIAAAPVENVVGVLPGPRPQRAGLALLAHYDSVPGSPGAADDYDRCRHRAGGGCAPSSPRRAGRDVMVVITDGEEAGLLGPTTS